MDFHDPLHDPPHDPLHDPLEALRADPDLMRAGHQVRAEERAEAEAYEALAAKGVERSRTLRDVALQLCHRGDLVEVSTGAATLVGRFVYAAGDLACLVTPALEVDLVLTGPLSVTVVERARRGGVTPGRGPESFKARLFEHEAGAGPVIVGLRPPFDEVEGTIAAVAVDHVVLHVERGVRYLALAGLAYVARSR